MPCIDQEKPKAMLLAFSYVDQLMKMSGITEPLWIELSDEVKFLNREEYSRMFPWEVTLGQHLKLKTQASCETNVVPMDYLTLIESFLHAVSLI